jgi:hypothetical protein
MSIKVADKIFFVKILSRFFVFIFFHKNLKLHKNPLTQIMVHTKKKLSHFQFENCLILKIPETFQNKTINISTQIYSAQVSTSYHIFSFFQVSNSTKISCLSSFYVVTKRK